MKQCANYQKSIALKIVPKIVVSHCWAKLMRLSFRLYYARTRNCATDFNLSTTEEAAVMEADTELRIDSCTVTKFHGFSSGGQTTLEFAPEPLLARVTRRLIPMRNAKNAAPTGRLATRAGDICAERAGPPVELRAGPNCQRELATHSIAHPSGS